MGGMGVVYAALKGELATYIANVKPGYKATIIAVGKPIWSWWGTDTVYEKYELILVGPPQGISEAYKLAMEFLCNRVGHWVQLLRTTTTTNDYYTN